MVTLIKRKRQFGSLRALARSYFFSQGGSIKSLHLNPHNSSEWRIKTTLDDLEEMTILVNEIVATDASRVNYRNSTGAKIIAQLTRADVCITSKERRAAFIPEFPQTHCNCLNEGPPLLLAR